VRALRTGIVIVLIALGFLGGYFAGWFLHGENVVRLDSGERDAALRAGVLQQRIIEELQGRYYKRIDADDLSTRSVKALLESLDDPYTVYLPPEETARLREMTEGEYSGIGAALEKKGKRLLITRVFPGSPAAAAGLAAGDQIVTVDGRPTADEAIETSVSRIKGEAGSEVELEVRRTGASEPETLTVERRRIEIPQTETRMLRAGGREGEKVGYVQLYEFADGAGDQLREQVDGLEARGAKALILDLRYNGGGLLSEAVDVTNVFMRGEVTSTKGLHSPLEVYEATEEPATGLPLVVLVNEYSASASEIVTGALNDTERATIVGTTTFGKGLVQSIVPLDGESSLKLTTAVYYTPNGTNIDKRGIEPDVRAPDDPETERDEGLQRALSLLAR
jgi:carboxyl-terminal processing protease